MAVTSADLLDYLYYRCLPGIYQEEDANIGKPLYRYLQSIILGGYDLAIQDIDNTIKLVDPETCPELRRRRGTYSCIRFLVRVLTGMDVKLSYLRGEYNGQLGRHLIISLQAKTVEELLNLDISVSIVSKFVEFFTPYYITTHVIGEVTSSNIRGNKYVAGVITYYSSYQIGGE